MAIARTSSGRTFSSFDEINELISPTRIGCFNLPSGYEALVQRISLPLSQQDADRLLDSFDAEMDRQLRAEGFVYRRVGCLTRGDATNPNDKSLISFYTCPGPSGVLSEEHIQQYTLPHRLSADDRHHVYAGMIGKGLVLADGSQALVYVTRGEWIRMHKETLNWPVFPYDGPNLAISYFDSNPDPATRDFTMQVDEAIEKMPE